MSHVFLVSILSAFEIYEVFWTSHLFYFLITSQSFVDLQKTEDVVEDDDDDKGPYSVSTTSG